MRIGCGPRFTFRDIPPGLMAMGFGPRGWGGGWEGGDWSADSATAAAAAAKGGCSNRASFGSSS